MTVRDSPTPVAGSSEQTQRAAAYRMFATLLGRELTPADAGALARMEVPSGPAAGAPELPPDLWHHLSALAAVTAKSVTDDQATDLAVDYARLFLGAGGPPLASPYESAYRGEARLYGTAAAEVRALLGEWGLQAPRNFGPEDHICVELSLLAALAERGAAEGRSQEQVLAAQHDLLRDHLLVWFPAFAARVEDAATGPFYGTLVALIAAFLQADARYLREELEEAKRYE
jgi:TorA specific chaperone